MSQQNIFETIFGTIFHNSAEKLWNDLTPEEQETLKQGPGIVAIINTHLKDEPSIVKDLITKQYSSIGASVLEIELMAICKDLNLPMPIDFDSAIATLQNYLGSKIGTKWKWASSSLAELLTVALSPGTIFEKVSVLIVYAYNKYIKK
jgi:hypothetical protein